MFERFTNDARAVVRCAVDSARQVGHRYVGTEHLLLAVAAAVAAADAPAGAVLREQGVTPELVKEQIIRQVGLGVGADAIGRYVPPDRQHLPFTPRARKILELAFREALELRDAHIGVEHIALVLIGAENGLAPNILTALHAHASSLRTAILNRYRQAS